MEMITRQKLAVGVGLSLMHGPCRGPKGSGGRYVDGRNHCVIGWSLDMRSSPALRAWGSRTLVELELEGALAFEDDSVRALAILLQEAHDLGGDMSLSTKDQLGSMLGSADRTLLDLYVQGVQGVQGVSQ